VHMPMRRTSGGCTLRQGGQQSEKLRKPACSALYYLHPGLAECMVSHANALVAWSERAIESERVDLS
jgi:hypothetical protein